MADTSPTDAVTQRGIGIFLEFYPDAEVTGEYHDDVSAWTWTVLMPMELPEGAEVPEGVQPKHGASRQFVATDEMPEPTDEYLRLVATEIASTFQTGASA